MSMPNALLTIDILKTFQCLMLVLLCMCFELSTNWWQLVALNCQPDGGQLQTTSSYSMGSPVIPAMHPGKICTCRLSRSLFLIIPISVWGLWCLLLWYKTSLNVFVELIKLLFPRKFNDSDWETIKTGTCSKYLLNFTCTIIQIMNVYECNGENIFIRWKMECSMG